MSLVQNRQYLYEYGQNTYHLVERGEKPFSVLSNPNYNQRRYLKDRQRENVGHSFEHIYDDVVVDTREEFMNRHFIPSYRKMDIRRRNANLKSCK